MARSTVARVLLSSLPIYSPSRALSIVRICSSRTVDSVLRPLVIIATWVGKIVIENIDDPKDIVCDGDCENCPVADIDCDGDCEDCPCSDNCDESEAN